MALEIVALSRAITTWDTDHTDLNGLHGSFSEPRQLHAPRAGNFGGTAARAVPTGLPSGCPKEKFVRARTPERFRATACVSPSQRLCVE